MAETVLATNDQLVHRQAELWQSAMNATHEQWQQVMAGAGKKIEVSLSTVLVQAMREHAAALSAAEQDIAGQTTKQWAGVESALAQNANALVAQQQELVRQGEVLVKIVEATGQVARLEAELNRNLETLSGAHHFEQTVLSLSAAIQLLTARLGGAESTRVELKTGRPGKAA
jgi:hypothetical protein